MRQPGVAVAAGQLLQQSARLGRAQLLQQFKGARVARMFRRGSGGAQLAQQQFDALLDLGRRRAFWRLVQCRRRGGAELGEILGRLLASLEGVGVEILDKPS